VDPIAEYNLSQYTLREFKVREGVFGVCGSSRKVKKMHGL